MLAFALIVLAIQLAPSEPMPMAASTGRCTSSVEDCICCEYGPAMSCDGRSDGYDAVFETDFSQTHSAMIGGRRAQAVPDETSLLLYREIDDENLEEVTCWEHQQTYRVQLVSNRSDPHCKAMKGFALQLHPDSRGSFPLRETYHEALQSIGCNTVSHRRRLTEFNPSPNVTFRYRASKNANYKEDVVFRYIVVYSYLDYVQTSRRFPHCSTTEPPPEATPQPSPCSDRSSQTESDSHDSTMDDESETETPQDPEDFRQILLPPAPTDPELPTLPDPEEEEMEGSTPEEEEHHEVGTTCGKNRPLSNYTRLYNDTATNIQYVCNLVTPVTEIQCISTCEKEEGGRNMTLCCEVRDWRRRSREFECTACSSQGDHPNIRKTLEIDIPKLCRCWECDRTL